MACNVRYGPSYGTSESSGGPPKVEAVGRPNESSAASTAFLRVPDSSSTDRSTLRCIAEMSRFRSLFPLFGALRCYTWMSSNIARIVSWISAVPTSCVLLATGCEDDDCEGIKEVFKRITMIHRWHRRKRRSVLLNSFGNASSDSTKIHYGGDLSEANKCGISAS